MEPTRDSAVNNPKDAASVFSKWLQQTHLSIDLTKVKLMLENPFGRGIGVTLHTDRNTALNFEEKLPVAIVLPLQDSDVYHRAGGAVSLGHWMDTMWAACSAHKRVSAGEIVQEIVNTSPPHHNSSTSIAYSSLEI
ncbi:hypothetical protein J6590_036233 [Homalodisca vitripennis]|nr:hypothetical protein J6590_036233 [Homalodisca vitripennis]